MKYLGIIICSILLGFGSQALAESGIFYPDAVERAPQPPPQLQAAMRVIGEIRSVDESRQPRMWAAGRPGTVRYGRIDIETDLCVNDEVEFGLTYGVVPWEAASQACPVGTWVCTKEEIDGVECNTARPDSLETDYYNCTGNGLSWLSVSHIGWLADANPSYLGLAPVQDEQGNPAQGIPCFRFPVWCCSEVQP